jgi:hypothetical protein
MKYYVHFERTTIDDEPIAWEKYPNMSLQGALYHQFIDELKLNPDLPDWKIIDVTYDERVAWFLVVFETDKLGQYSLKNQLQRCFTELGMNGFFVIVHTIPLKEILKIKKAEDEKIDGQGSA